MAEGNYHAITTSGVDYNLVYDPGVLGVGANYDLTITNPDLTTTVVSNITPGNVATPVNGTSSLSIASLLGNTDYVVAPGATATVNIAAALLGTSTVYVGGNATINSGISLLSNMNLVVDGGTATAAGGSLGGALSGLNVDLENGGTFANGTAVLSALNGTTINFGDGGGTFIANAGGAVLDLSSTTINSFDAATDKIEFQGLAGSVDHYTITSSGGTQTINLFDSNNNPLGNVSVAGTSFPTGSFVVGQAGPLTISANGAAVDITPVATPCFVSGTHILTVRGEVAVEDLKVGDLAITATGETRPIIWIGNKRLEQPVRNEWPIRVRAGAFGDNLPARDLLLSGGHAVCVDLMGEVFVPVGELANGATIVREEWAEVTYWHVELESHDVLMAEGLGCESYMEVGNRAFFGKAYGRLVEVDAAQRVTESLTRYARPFVDRGVLVEAIRERLIARAEALGWSRAVDMDLHMLVDGKRVEGQIDGDLARFIFPASAKTASLVSRTFSPGREVRALGVRFESLRIFDGLKTDRDVALNDLVGVHPEEVAAGCNWSWTDGHLVLPATLWADCKGHVILRLTGYVEAGQPWVAPEEKDVAGRRAA
ncbi:MULTISPECIES: Hint domain-containing protein [unclassified Rhizobium]|uniref:Hint domain-containing protein n=1 Tax=unclassified Rhizobium TaxID=2613769 RepID=UPI000EA8B141|nr:MULTISPECIES: Hint domain-containing protein [unclassified Rhizobium]AYG68904.1 hypothetical protein CCGE531_22790 [Rhizobium sp. CCGE531]AYG75290.1 hypothetical protein CCGE532_22275 [Rhizobium sp. CCGE532]